MFHRTIILPFSIDLVLSGTFWYHSHLATQYCDGLRGGLVIYDPNDPHAALYDVDDGTPHLQYQRRTVTDKSHSNITDSTVLTLADW